ncbi:MAG: hypothetical protein ACJ8E6_04435, partial [Sphingomicrobium sp.]
MLDPDMQRMCFVKYGLMVLTTVIRWLNAPPATGRLALLCGIFAVALPTAIRAAIDGVVTGCEFTPYLPFVLLSAILLRWWQASAVALASVAILGGLFAHPDHSYLSPCFLSAAAIFLASSAAIIGTVVAARRLLAASRFCGVDGSEGGIIFSLEHGEVLASWPGSGPPV